MLQKNDSLVLGKDIFPIAICGNSWNEQDAYVYVVDMGLDKYFDVVQMKNQSGLLKTMEEK